MKKADVSQLFVDLEQSLKKIKTLIAWQQLKREETQPGLPPSFMLDNHAEDDLRDAYSLNDKVFPKFNKSTGASMIKLDLETAELPYKDEAGRFADFHSLRHSFISNLGKSGASIKEAQHLARHSTSALTLDVYTHIGLYDERQAVEKMPQLHIGDKDKENPAVAS